MPAKTFKRYDPRTKAAIIEAAVAARKAGKTWAEAFEAAQAVGFRGRLPRLVRFVERGVGHAKKPGPKAARRPSQAEAQALAKAQEAGTFRYDKATKTEIIEAARMARALGKTWAEAFQAAREAGYRGSLGGMVQMVRKASGKVPGRRGRPARGQAPEAPGGIPAVGALIEKLVKDRVRAVLGGVIADLQKARGSETTDEHR